MRTALLRSKKTNTLNPNPLMLDYVASMESCRHSFLGLLKQRIFVNEALQQRCSSDKKFRYSYNLIIRCDFHLSVTIADLTLFNKFFNKIQNTI